MNFEKKLKIQLACGILWICLGVLACVAVLQRKRFPLVIPSPIAQAPAADSLPRASSRSSSPFAF